MSNKYKMSEKYPSPPPLATSEMIGDPSESGFQVEFRDGYFYIAKVPPGYTELKVGDRVLEINGVKAFNFGSSKTANALFDTVCMVYIPKEELMRKRNGKKKYHDDDDTTSSEESTLCRKGRRSMFEEEARKEGAFRLSAQNLDESLRKEKQEEKELRQLEREIRQLERADRERRADKELRRSRILFPGIHVVSPGAYGHRQRPSILFSPAAKSNKKTLRSSIMESITRSPSTSDRKTRASMIETQKSPSTSERKLRRYSISVVPSATCTEEKKKDRSSSLKKSKGEKKKDLSNLPLPLTLEESPKKIKEEIKKDRRRSSSPVSISSEQKKKIKDGKEKYQRRSSLPASITSEPKKKIREEKKKARRRRSVSSVSSASSRLSEVSKKSSSSISEVSKKSRTSLPSISSTTISEQPAEVVPKEFRPRNPVSGPIVPSKSDLPKLLKRRSSVMVEMKREMGEKAAREGGEALSPEHQLKIKNRNSSVKVDRNLGNYKSGSSQRWSKLSPNHKTNG